MSSTEILFDYIDKITNMIVLEDTGGLKMTKYPELNGMEFSISKIVTELCEDNMKFLGALIAISKVAKDCKHGNNEDKIDCINEIVDKTLNGGTYEN